MDDSPTANELVSKSRVPVRQADRMKVLIMCVCVFFFFGGEGGGVWVVVERAWDYIGPGGRRCFLRSESFFGILFS